jgi:hypothetical protein
MPAFDGDLRFAAREKPGTMYPFRLRIAESVAGKEMDLALGRAEAESLMDDLYVLLNPPEAVVQVSIRGGAARDSDSLYSYNDPSGELQPGDLVRVPFGHRDEPTIAVVKQLGRGAYDGPLKSVLAKFQAEEL